MDVTEGEDDIVEDFDLDAMDGDDFDGDDE